MIRIGTGYDVHRLVPERKLILCGVEVPCELGLLGHSDADVAVHALMDAILGALAMGDIGKLFPDSDPQYKGADSMKPLGCRGVPSRLPRPDDNRGAPEARKAYPRNAGEPRGGVRLRYFAGERKSHHRGRAGACGSGYRKPGGSTPRKVNQGAVRYGCARFLVDEYYIVIFFVFHVLQFPFQIG